MDIEPIDIMSIGDGAANGYYLLSTLEPDQQGIGGNTGGGFSIGQNAIVGIKKAEIGSSYRDMLAFFKGTSGGVTYSGLSTTETDSLIFCVYPKIANP